MVRVPTGATVPPLTHMPLLHKPAAPPAAAIVPFPVSKPPLIRSSGEIRVPPPIVKLPVERLVPNNT